MTNPTPHGQVPEALIDLIDAYAETRHRCGGVYNAKTEAARKAVIEDLREALGGVQALSAAPVAFLKSVIALCSHRGYSPANIEAWDKDDKWIADLWRQAESMLTASPTPPAEQQAPKETFGGVNGWRDISTAPKDGSRFVATGHNYGLYSEDRHTCVAQWFQGCWMEASDWNETSELKYLTHWMPLPSPPDDVAAPAEQAAPKAAPGGLAASAAKGAIMGAAYDFRDAHVSGSMNLKRSAHAALEAAVDSALAAPQQEAQEPVAYVHVPHFTVEGKVRPVVSFEKYQQDYADGIYSTRIPLYTAPQPAPAPLSEMPYEKRKAIQEGEQIGASDAWFHARHNMLDTLDRRNVFRAGFDRGWNAAIAAQGGQ